jgi:hypothetical protein
LPGGDRIEAKKIWADEKMELTEEVKELLIKTAKE